MQGFITLAFDHRSQGASEGTPRHLEDPFAGAEDTKSAVTYLTTLDKVNPKRIGVLGICAGGGYGIAAASSDSRIKTLAQSDPLAVPSISLLPGVMTPLLRSFARIERIAPRPFLIVAGADADTIEHSRVAFSKAVGEKKEFYAVEGATHMDLYDHKVGNVVPKLTEFFKTNM
ncbi:MAG: Alpha/Beta hydrolase protein [Linnemannia gamsii]|nr:MAG: Alpha/Beta hydrolase protein [Linnemannia gamsii]